MELNKKIECLKLIMIKSDRASYSAANLLQEIENGKVANWQIRSVISDALDDKFATFHPHEILKLNCVHNDLV